MKSTIAAIMMLSLLGTTPRTRAATIWIETERFGNLGGWVNDPQFIDLMGSPYLLASGIGKPVADATTKIPLPAPAKYRLWARTKDWYPSHHPGKFQILVNGKAAATTFGQSGQPGWRWEDGGVHDLSGNVELALHDLTGYYGRCDAILLADDLHWTPPAAVEAIAKLREQHGGVSREIKDMPPRDIVIVGGGLTGCTAAVAAARNGASVALLQNRPVLGGNASTEILVPPVGVWPHGNRLHMFDPRETGLVEEYRTIGNQRVIEGKLYSERLLRWVKLEPNLDLHLNLHATGVEMEKGSKVKISAVLAIDVTTGQRMRFPARLFIDCSGDSVVGIAAGAESRQGKEPKSMHNEPWAPEKPNTNTMGNELKYFHRDVGHAVKFESPGWVYPFLKCEDFGPGRHPRFMTTEEIGWQWMIELGGMQDTYAEAEEIRDDLFRLILGLWDHTKNHCARDQKRASTHDIVWLGHIAGKRENRRLIGDYILTQNDIGEQTLFPDRVAYGGWVVDDHHSGGFFHKGSFGKHEDDRKHAYLGLEFSIPFRTLYSKNVENLMMAGRNHSATHLAMSNTRVMLTCAIMGHAAGTGAAMCIERSTTPRGLCNEYIKDLQQQLLREGAYIIDLPADDPRDLARKARATASSQGAYKGKAMPPSNVIDGRARFESGQTSAWAPEGAASGPHWIELAWDKPVTFNVVHVTFQTAALAPQRFELQARQNGAWKRITEVTQNRHRRHVLGLDKVTTDKLRVAMDDNRGICEIRVYEEAARVVEIARRAHANMRLPDKGPWLPWDDGKSPPTPAEPEKPEPQGLSLSDATKKYGSGIVQAQDAVVTGTWTPSTYSAPFIGDGYLHDGNAQKGQKSIRFDLASIKPGRYEVRLAYVAYKNRSDNTPVIIRTASGEKSVTVNQRKTPEIDGLFHSLGTFELDARSSVTIATTGTSDYVVVDAIQVIARP